MTTIMLAVIAAQECCCRTGVDAMSPNGRYRVVVERVADGHHRVNAARARWLEHDADGWHERRAFDLWFRRTECFYPRLEVSPTGSGFLVELDGLAFYGADGRLWGEWRSGERIFLPLGAPLSDELRSELHALLTRMPANAATRKLVAQLEIDDLEERDAARIELTRRGIDALDALAEARTVEARAIVDRVPRWSWLLARPGRIEEAWTLYADEIDDLIAQLGDPDIAVRDRAVVALKKCGRAALPKLEAVATADLEVLWRGREVIAHLKRLQSSRGVLVRWRVDESGACARTVEAADAAGPRNRIEREGVVGGAESFSCVVDTGAPVEWHPDEYDGWRAVLLRDLDGPVDTDVPAVYHLLARANGFAFAVEKLASLRTNDPLVAGVIRKAIERQRRSE